MKENQIINELEKYRWYHRIKLTETLCTPGSEKLIPLQDVVIRAISSIDLSNKRVLDIGCRDGLFCFEAEKLGAQDIIGIDNDLSQGAVNFLIPYFQSKVQMYQLNLFDLKRETFGDFDVVIFPGVLYHLRYPFWGLKLIKDVLQDGGFLILETAVLLDENKQSLLFCPIGDDSPFEPTSCTFFNLKGLLDTLSSIGFDVQEIELMNNNHLLEYTPEGVILSTDSRQKPKGLHWKGSESKEQVIDRITLICQKNLSLEDEPVMNYWNKTHKVHTTGNL
jgi:SAM-dependent methyltransferase